MVHSNTGAFLAYVNIKLAVRKMTTVRTAGILVPSPFFFSARFLERELGALEQSRRSAFPFSGQEIVDWQMRQALFKNDLLPLRMVVVGLRLF